MARSKRGKTDINSSSMADIAFLLLIFFLVTTTIANDRGLSMQLPPKPDQNQDIIKIPERNNFKILINSADRLLVEGEPLEDPREIRLKAPYIIQLRNEGITVKMIESDHMGGFLLKSVNPNMKDRTIDPREIVRMYQVVKKLVTVGG